jgi:methionine-rich copper-binding protein CopC
VRSTLVVGVLVGGALLGSRGVGAADGTLADSTPAANSTVEAAPGRLLLSFDKPVTGDFVRVTLVGPDGGQWADPDPVVSGKEVAVEVRGDLTAGSYAVSYRTQSEDGHPIRGSYTFTLAPQESASETALRTTAGAHVEDYRAPAMWAMLALAVLLPATGFALTARQARRGPRRG